MRYSIFILLLFCGCTSKSFFPTTKQLNSQGIVFEKPFSMHVQIAVSDSLFVAADLRNDPMIFVYSLPDFKLISNIGKKGNGPGELLAISNVKIDNEFKIWAYDFYKNEFLAFDVNHDMPVNHLKIPDEENRPMTLYADFISEREYAVYRPDAIDGTGVFQIFSDGRCIKSIGKLPARNEDVPEAAFAQAYLAHYAYNARLTKMAVAYSYTNKIDIVDMTNDSIITIYGEKYFEPNYTFTNNGYFAVTQNTILAYRGIDIDDQYIYALYDGNKFSPGSGRSKEIHVFDWNGNPVCKFLLSHETGTMTVDYKKKKIYTISPDVNNNLITYNFDL